MRLAELLDDAFELFVRFEQILVNFVHLLSQLQYLAVGFVDQLSSYLEAVFPSLYPLDHLLDSLIDLLIPLLPLLHLSHLHLRWGVVVAGFGLESARFGPLKQSLPLLCQSFLLPHDLFFEFC